ncbi:LTA synthase family protein [Bacteriovorax sp. Seq25_V]|uniref:LTA synthase family protein n=1 Tax=Bacteriovorax sp. Seq25_V TaxID=1201288 RepID=UPI000389E3AA|nr:LTA synthase family protein [Bacteriovorax sp. Seq25_V]EQC43438.1 arylsulfatase [Bacteriovorax sp. Seq25_V]
MFSEESVKVIFDTLRTKDILNAVGLGVIMLLIHWKWKSFSADKGHVNYKKGLRKIVILFVVIAMSPYTYGELSYIMKSAYEYYMGGKYPTGKLYEKLVSEEEPYRQQFKARFNNKKDVIIIAMESFNGLYTNKEMNGKELTPTINSLLKEGLFVEDFYGNSIQTAKGHFSILCGRTPLIRGKASYIADPDKLDCAPKLFKENGYTTFFHQSHGDLSFDNTDGFLRSIGFETLRVSRSELLTEEQRKKNIWGWGMQDNFSYEQFIDSFKELKKQGKPVFAMMATISHHMKFRGVPKDQRYIYPEASNNKEYFFNSLHLSDKYLATFVKRMKEEKLFDDTIIVIVGDHSFPAGEHWYYDNQASYYQEFFKIPLIIISKDQIQPKIISKQTFSQVNILPTLLDLTGYKGEVRLQAKSMFSTPGEYAHLIQPYNGLYFGVAKYPYKLVWEKRSNRYFLYDLEKDPMEENSISNEQIFDEFKEQMDVIIYNDKAIRKN